MLKSKALAREIFYKFALKQAFHSFSLQAAAAEKAMNEVMQKCKRRKHEVIEGDLKSETSEKVRERVIEGGVKMSLEKFKKAGVEEVMRGMR